MTLAANCAFAATDTNSIQWVQLSPAVSPSPRSYMSMAYDALTGKTIMFGGFDGTSYLNDTWIFDGTNWTQVTTPVAPSARVNMQMAFDLPSRRIVLFGGYNGRYLGDTWIWDSETLQWTQAAPAHSPPAVTGPMLFNDPNGSVDVFGGFDGHFYQLTMWQWTGSDWNQLSMPEVPYARSSAAVGLNPFTREVVMFGGLADVNPINTWTYNRRTWKLQSPAEQPLLVYGPSTAFDLNLKSVILFGGASGGYAQNTTWRWSGSTWNQLHATQAPPRREGAGISYDPTAGHLVIFGGQSGNTFLGDTWELVP